MLHSIYKLPPNRVRRNYLGGLFLEQFAGKEIPKDGHQPEDWIGSTVVARNPGLEAVENEGLAFITDESNNKLLLKDIFADHTEYFLGSEHKQKLGSGLGFLAKLLDSSMRLHIQAHPTSQWASQHLNSRWGKLETYFILGVRPESDGYIWLGFQNCPTKAEWERIVIEQDMEKMHACFEKVLVKPGEVWLIPGGLPHAIGEGLFVLEVMEPTDWVVRCEFERSGLVVPPQARYMGMEPLKALDIFHFEENSVEEITSKYRVKPQPLPSPEGAKISLLIGPQQTECFNIKLVEVSREVEIKKENVIQLGVVSVGSAKIATDTESLDVKRGDTFLIPANTKKIKISPQNGSCDIVLCSPGYGLEKELL